MTKILKRFLIVLIVLIGTILAMPKEEQATVNATDSTIIYGIDTPRKHDYTGAYKTLGELKNGATLYGVEDWILHNKNVFCIQKNQDIPENGEWKITKKELKIDSSSSNWLKGLAYILNEATTGMSDTYHDYKNDEIQLAVWSYLERISSDPTILEEANDFFGDVDISGNEDFSYSNSIVANLVKDAINICRGENSR